MARLMQIPPFTGTKDGMVVYKRKGKYYVRTKSTLSGNVVKTSTAFKNTMKSARLLGRASSIASVVYKQLPNKVFQDFRKLTGIAIMKLKAGSSDTEVLTQMKNQFLSKNG